MLDIDGTTLPRNSSDTEAAIASELKKARSTAKPIDSAIERELDGVRALWEHDKRPVSGEFDERLKTPYALAALVIEGGFSEIAIWKRWKAAHPPEANFDVDEYAAETKRLKRDAFPHAREYGAGFYPGILDQLWCSAMDQASRDPWEDGAPLPYDIGQKVIHPRFGQAVVYSHDENENSIAFNFGSQEEPALRHYRRKNGGQEMTFEVIQGGKKTKAKDDREGKKPQADILLGFIETEAKLFHSPDGKTFADIMVDGHRETWAIKSTGFRRWLVKRYFTEMKGAPSATAKISAIEVADAMASTEGAEFDMHIRVAEHGGKYYLDLCDRNWRCVEIGPDGWRIITAPPVRFRRWDGMLPLPIPIGGGSIEDLKPFVNVRDRDLLIRPFEVSKRHT